MRKHLWIAVVAWTVACGGGAGAPSPAAPGAVAADADGDAQVVARDGAGGGGIVVGRDRDDVTLAPLPPLPTTPQPAPDALFGTVRIAEPLTFLAEAAGFAAEYRPELGLRLRADVLSAQAAQVGLDLSGIDLAQPIRALYLDPDQFGIGLALVVGVADAAALEELAATANLAVRIRGGFAVIGTRDVVIAAGGYAMTTLLDEPLPADPTLVIELGNIVRQNGAGLDRMLGEILAEDTSSGAKREGIRAMLGGYGELIRQIERIELTAELDDARASLIARIDPTAGTGLADFIDRQVPGKFDLLAQLPTGPVSAGGAIDLQPIMKAMKPMIDAIADSMPASNKSAHATFERWLALANGENAMVFDLPASGITMSALWDVREPSEVMALGGEYYDSVVASLESAALGAFEIDTQSVKHRGVKLTTITLDTTAAPPAGTPDTLHGYFGPDGVRVSAAVPGQRLALTVGPDATTRAKALIDLAKRKKPAPVESTLMPVLADARRRGESYVLAIDLLTFSLKLGKLIVATMGATDKTPLPPEGLEPAVFALGASGGVLGLRLTMPKAQLAAFRRP